MNNHIKRLFRNTENKMLGGVAAGLADYFELDVTIVRVLFVLTVFIPFSFPIVFAYLVLWVVMPARKQESPMVSLENPGQADN